MAIYAPGHREGRRGDGANRRNAVAVLQLTAMVDMFTVLVVFLLQNWAQTNEILPLPDAVDLPSAESVKDLSPSTIVIISNAELRLNTQIIADYLSIKEQEDWLVEPLRAGLERLILEGEEKKRVALRDRVRQAISQSETQSKAEDEIDEFRKVTIQAEKSIDFLTVKKIMYTATEAGISQINFAVLKKEKPTETL